MHNKIAKKVLDRGGITLQLHGNSLVDVTEVTGDYWYYSVLPDRTVIVDAHDLPATINAFVAANTPELQRPNRYLGIWENPASNQYYIDINERANSRAKAKKHIEQINQNSVRKILAMYNPSTSVTVTC